MAFLFFLICLVNKFMNEQKLLSSMRIFSVDDFVAGRLPRRENFQPSIDIFEQECVLPYLGTDVYGTLLYGSANRDDFTVASDVDYLMVVFTEGMYECVHHATARALQDRNVLISTRVITLDDAQDGIHGVDKDFLGHLFPNCMQYGWKGQNPLEILADDGLTLEQATRLTVIRYSKRLVIGYTSPTGSEAEYLDFLKSILEKPWHTMRAALQYRKITLERDSKHELIQRYRTEVSDSRLVEDILSIQRVGKRYIGHLRRRQEEEQEPRYWRRVHEEMLREIEALYPTALHFIDGNKRMMKPKQA